MKIDNETLISYLENMLKILDTEENKEKRFTQGYILCLKDILELAKKEIV